MSILHVAWALEQRTKTASEKLVLLCLAEAANVESGECWPAQETIARRCQMTREGTNRIIQRLVAMKLVSTESRRGPNGEGMPSVYTLPPLSQVIVDHTPCDPGSLVKATVNNTPKVPLEKARKAKPELTYAEWVASLATGQRPLPAADPIFAYATKIGLPFDFLRLAWLEFRRKHSEGSGSSKKQKDWRQTFRNYVEGNFLKLWFLDAGEFRLTTVGAQAQKLHEADNGR